MKPLALAAMLTILFTSCRGPGGPATRTGRAIDHGANAVGRGVERTGEKIQEISR